MRRTAIILASASVASVALAVPSWWQSLPGGTALSSRMDWGETPTMAPPLDPAILQRRALTTAEGADPGTSSVLALYLENTTGSGLRHPWAQYTELHTDHSTGAAGSNGLFTYSYEVWA